MNATILNRVNEKFVHPADGWYMIEPRGEHPNRRGGVVQIIDDEAGASIANRFNADAAAGKLSHGRELLIDHEHFKHDDDKETRAYGWLTALQNRSDGIYGQVRWSDTGRKAVDGGDYRFFSTEYDPADLKVLNDGKLRRVRPLRLDGLTLTNDPNNRGGKPITNRSVPAATDDGDELSALLLNKARSEYQNADGTFKEMALEKGGAVNAFNGCVLHMMNEEGHAQDSAKAICGKIAQQIANRMPRMGDGTFTDCDGASQCAHDASTEAYTASTSDSHAKASDLHAVAAVAQEKAGNKNKAENHRRISAAHKVFAGGASPAVANRDPKNFPGASAPPNAVNQEQQNKKMKDIAILLGLSEDAAPEAVSAAVTKLKNRNAELETETQTLLGEQCQAILDGCGIKPDDKRRAHLVGSLKVLKNRSERLAHLADFGILPLTGKASAATPQTKLLNRDTQPPMGEPGATGAAAIDKATADKINNRASEIQEDYRKRGKAVPSQSTAFRMAQTEIVPA